MLGLNVIEAFAKNNQYFLLGKIMGRLSVFHCVSKRSGQMAPTVNNDHKNTTDLAKTVGRTNGAAEF